MSTTQRYSVYCHRGGKKPEKIHFEEAFEVRSHLVNIRNTTCQLPLLHSSLGMPLVWKTRGGSGGAAVQGCEQWSEQVLPGEVGLLLHHEEHRPGGHTLELLSCQLVLEVQEVEDLHVNKKQQTHHK